MLIMTPESLVRTLAEKDEETLYNLRFVRRGSTRTHKLQAQQFHHHLGFEQAYTARKNKIVCSLNIVTQMEEVAKK